MTALLNKHYSGGTVSPERMKNKKEYLDWRNTRGQLATNTAAWRQWLVNTECLE